MICILQSTFIVPGLLEQVAREKRADVLLLSEQYRNRDLPNWYSDSLGTAALFLFDSARFRVRSHGSAPDFVWANIDVVTFVSVYLTPSDEIRYFRRKVNALEDFLRSSTDEVEVASDFNAKAVEWGMPYPDSRGKYVHSGDGGSNRFKHPARWKLSHIPASREHKHDPRRFLRV